MGLKTLQAKYKEALADTECIEEFVTKAKEINKALAGYRDECHKLAESHAKAYEQIVQKIAKAEQQAKALETGTFVELKTFKNLLILAASTKGEEPKPIDLNEIATLGRDVRKGADEQLVAYMKAYVDKQEANWPKEIKAGMLFKHKDGTVFEASGPGTQLEGKTGDESMRYKGNTIENYGFKTSPMARTMVGDKFNAKSGWSYLKV